MLKKIITFVIISLFLGFAYLSFFVNFNFSYLLNVLKNSNLLYGIPIFLILIIYLIFWIYKIILADKFKYFESLKVVVIGSFILLVLIILLPFINFIIEMFLNKKAINFGYLLSQPGLKIFLLSGSVLAIAIPIVLIAYLSAIFSSWGFQSKFVIIFFMLILFIFVGSTFKFKHEVSMNLGESLHGKEVRIEFFEGLLKRHPSFPNRETAILRLGVWNFDLKKYSEAEKWFTKVLETKNLSDEYSVESYYSRGISYFHLGQMEKSVKDLTTLLSKYPDNLYEKEVLLSLAKLNLESDDPDIEKAKGFFLTLDKKYPESPEMKLNKKTLTFIIDNEDNDFEPLKRFYKIEKKIDSAEEMEILEELKSIIKDYPNSKIVDDVMFHIASIYRRNFDNHNAFITYRDIQRKFPSSPHIEEIKQVMDKIVWKVYEVSNLKDVKEFYQVGLRGMTCYLSTDRGFYYYDDKKKAFKIYARELETSKPVTSFKFIDGLLYICSIDGSVKIYNEKKKSLHIIYDGKEDVTIKPVIKKIANDVWIGSYSGLLVYNPKTGKKIRYTNKDGLGSNIVKDIMIDNNRTVWIATSGGLSRYNLKTRKWHPSVSYSDPNTQTTLTDFSTLLLVKNSIWAGSSKGMIEFHLKEEYSDPYLLMTFIRKIFFMDNFIWILGVKELSEKDWEREISVRRLNLTSKLADEYSSGPAKDSFAEFGISPKYLWLGNLTGDISRFDRKNETWKTYQVFKEKTLIKGIVPVRNGVWILTKNNLAFFDQNLEDLRQK
ncbi:tetratricopeptide repeat protein [Candidatus Dependentiae bacterium]|nr:tetratricopeptide repeat protein [Candidatus Dependentiae bacterium]